MPISYIGQVPNDPIDPIESSGFSFQSFLRAWMIVAYLSTRAIPYLYIFYYFRIITEVYLENKQKDRQNNPSKVIPRAI